MWTATAPTSSSPRPSACFADGENYKIFVLRPDGKGGYPPGHRHRPQQRYGGDISAVGDLAVTSTGEVVVGVAARQYEPPWSPPLTWQHRAYAWTGQAFTQTGGPTTASPAIPRSHPSP